MERMSPRKKTAYPSSFPLSLYLFFARKIIDIHLFKLDKKQDLCRAAPPAALKIKQNVSCAIPFKNVTKSEPEIGFYRPMPMIFFSNRFLHECQIVLETDQPDMVAGNLTGY